MIRARFRACIEDYRPTKWPYKHPYWCTGHGDEYSIVIAYADDIDMIKEYWPEASAIEITNETEYEFSDRFPKPTWFNEND